MDTPSTSRQSEIIHLNVGGQRFSTSKSTLNWISDTFFTSLLSGRINSAEDETGAVSFSFLNFLFRNFDTSIKKIFLIS